MDKLIATETFDAALPLEIGQAKLSALPVAHLTSLAPFGATEDLSAALEAAHGMKLPKANRSTGKTASRVLWFGRNEYLLMGPAPDPSLTPHAAVVDVSDGWAVAVLEGTSAVDVLARLVPVDLREAAFKRGHSLRSQIYHMPASITRLGSDKFMVMTFRSMAKTLVHDLKTAMAGVASRG